MPSGLKFSRISYGRTPPPKPGRYTVLDVSQVIGKAGVDAIKAADPAVAVLCYAAIDVVDSLLPGQVGTMPPSPAYTEAEYLHSALPFTRANRVCAQWNAGTRFRMDLTHPMWQSRVIAWVKHLISTGGYDGIFQDGVDLVRSYGVPHLPATVYTWLGGGTPNTTDADWQAAEMSMLRALTTALHPLGKIVAANIGGGTMKPVAWQQFMTVADVALEESWTVGTNGLPYWTPQWRQAVLNAQWAEAHGKPMMLNADVRGNLSLAHYALGSALLVANGLTMFDTSLGLYGTTENWLSMYDRAASLGVPLGVAVLAPSGLWSRTFHGGVVRVNPTGAAIGTLAAHTAAF